MQNNTTKDDVIIILGDAGINYYGDFEDMLLKQRLEDLPVTLFCIHGNHEARPQNIASYYRTIRFGGECYIESKFPDLLFAVDGEVYDFSGKKCIAIGGAYSVDKDYRLAMGYKWFDDEQPGDAVKRAVEDRLKDIGNRVDVVMSHTCPIMYLPTDAFLPGVDQRTVDRSTEVWLGMIEFMTHYDRWVCGHFHIDRRIGNMRFMFEKILPLEEL